MRVRAGVGSGSSACSRDERACSCFADHSALASRTHSGSRPCASSSLDAGEAAAAALTDEAFGLPPQPAPGVLTLPVGEFRPRFAELADDGTVGPSPRELLEALRAKVLRVRTALAHMRYG